MSGKLPPDCPQAADHQHGVHPSLPLRFADRTLVHKRRCRRCRRCAHMRRHCGQSMDRIDRRQWCSRDAVLHDDDAEQAAHERILTTATAAVGQCNAMQCNSDSMRRGLMGSAARQSTAQQRSAAFRTAGARRGSSRCGSATEICGTPQTALRCASAVDRTGPLITDGRRRSLTVSAAAIAQCHGVSAEGARASSGPAGDDAETQTLELHCASNQTVAAHRRRSLLCLRR